MTYLFRKQSPSALREALRIIERIATINNEDEKNAVLSDIYRIAHGHVGNCSNPHEDWINFSKEMGEKLKD